MFNGLSTSVTEELRRKCETALEEQASLLQQFKETEELLSQLQDTLDQQDETISQLRRELETCREDKNALMEDLQNANTANTLLIANLVKNQTVIALFEQTKREDLEKHESEKKFLLSENQRLKDVNAELIRRMDKNDRKLEKQKRMLEMNQKAIEQTVNIYNAQVNEVMEKLGRVGAIQNFMKYVTLPELGPYCSDPLVTAYRGLRNSELTPETAGKFMLAKFHLEPFDTTYSGIFARIKVRTNGNYGIILNRLNSVGPCGDTQFQADFFKLRGSDFDMQAEDFLEWYPVYYFPLGQMALNVFRCVKSKVADDDYKNIYERINSRQGESNNVERRTFHRIINGTKCSAKRMAKQFIIETDTPFNSIFSYWF